MTGKITIEENWHQQSEAAKSEAEKLPHGKERDALVRKARQLHTASQIHEWLVIPRATAAEVRPLPCVDGPRIARVFCVEQWSLAVMRPALQCGLT